MIIELTIFSIIVVLLGIWAFGIEPKMLVVKKYKLKDDALKNLKIVFVSDFHIKSNKEARLKLIVDTINAQNPDIILSGGDFAYGHTLKETLNLDKYVECLSKLKAKYGIYTVLGNHDWLSDGDKITSSLESIGINVLANSNLPVNIGNKTIYIAGVEDMKIRVPEVKKAIEGCKNPTILLSHTPDVFPDVPNSVNLTLAGHVHGGQVRLPFIGALLIPSKYGNRYSLGYIEECNKTMIVTKGIGNSILTVRFNCKPEITVIEFE